MNLVIRWISLHVLLFQVIYPHLRTLIRNPKKKQNKKQYKNLTEKASEKMNVIIENDELTNEVVAETIE